MEIFKMLLECSLSHFRASCNGNSFYHSFLFPEYRHWTSNHDVTENYVIQFDDLFCFHKIGDISLIINSSSIVPGTSSKAPSSWNKSHLDFFFIKFSIDYPNITLYQWSIPPYVNILIFEISIEAKVPEIFVITCHNFKWILNLLLQELYSSLPAAR